MLDLNVEDPPIEDVIELVFAREQRRRARNPFEDGVRSFVDFYLTAMRTQVAQFSIAPPRTCTCSAWSRSP